MSFVPGWQQKNVAKVSWELVYPLLKPMLLMPFPLWLTKLATLETVSIRFYVLSSPLLTVCPVCPISSPALVKHDHCCMERRCCRCTILLPWCCSDGGQPHTNHTNHTIGLPSLYTLWSLKSLCIGGCAFVFTGFVPWERLPWPCMPQSWLLSCRLLYLMRNLHWTFQVRR